MATGISKSAALNKELAGVRGRTLVTMPPICFCSNAAWTSGPPPSGRMVTLCAKPSLRIISIVTECAVELKRVMPSVWPFSCSVRAMSGWV